MRRDAFTRFLASKTGRSFFLSAAPGNSGDQLLQKGLEEYLACNDLSVTRTASDADIILMHGGGSIDDVWGTGTTHLRQILDSYPNYEVVVAPSSIHFTTTDLSAILNEYDQPIHLFARERRSHDRLRSMRFNENIRVNAAHDTAFLLEGTRYLEELRSRCTNEAVLCAMRTDRESTVVTFDLDGTPRSIWQLARYGIGQLQIRRFLAHTLPGAFDARDVVYRDISYEPFDTFLAAVTRASVVYTDRLHVGILAALLRKPVHMFPTRFDKIEGVYEMSLADYPNVTAHF